MSNKREAYRTYLESGHVINTITGILTELYELREQPENPMMYIRKALGLEYGIDIESLLHENQELKQKIADLNAEISLCQKQA